MSLYRAPEGDEVELLTLLAREGVMGHSDPRLDRFCDEASTLSRPDTFNRCHDLGWLTSGHDDRDDTSRVYVTAAGKAAISSPAVIDGDSSRDEP